MANKLEGKKIAILATDGFEQSELMGPMKALEQEGATCEIVSPKDETVRGWQHVNWGEELDVDVPLAEAKPEEYDALVLPGGQMNPDVLRGMPAVQRFVRAFIDAGKTVGAICHAPWILIDAGVVNGKRLTSWPSIRIDLRNAGANVVDEPCVVDGNIVTSRKPGDIPAFSAKLIEMIARERVAEAGEPKRGPDRPAPSQR
jgi:protease I